MFVRFRSQGNRLQVSLAQSRRAGGTIQAEHVGALGSVDAAVSVRSRLAFWAKLPQRLAGLGNRISPDEHPKLYAAVHVRIPMVTPDEQRAIQEENAKDDERFWDMMADMNASSAEGHQLLAASAEARRQAHERRAAEAAEKRGIARERLAKLARGESVAGGLGKRLDMAGVAKAGGLTSKQIRHARWVASCSEAEFTLALALTDSAKAADSAFDRELRRIRRARGAQPSLEG